MAKVKEGFTTLNNVVESSVSSGLVTSRIPATTVCEVMLLEPDLISKKRLLGLNQIGAILA